MAITFKKKEVVVEEVKAQLNKSQSVVVADYCGTKVSELSVLRSQARKAGVHVRVIKNTLIRRALEKTDFEVLQSHLTGPMIYAFSEDPVAAAKVFSDFSKDTEHFSLKLGALSQQGLLSEGDIKNLASLPSQEVLLSKLLEVLQAPIGQFARSLNEVPASLARVLTAVKAQKESAA